MCVDEGAVKITFSIEEFALNFFNVSQISFPILDPAAEKSVGSLKLELKTENVNNPATTKAIFTSLSPSKRPLTNSMLDSVRKPKVSKLSSSGNKNLATSLADVGSVLKKLNILPEVPDDLQCTLCPYKATAKNSLKTHYKLKHLGGGGLAVDCPICKQRFSLKKNTKRHMISAHQLSSEHASKLLD